MKRVGQLFEACFSRERLYQGYLDARRGKRGKRACFEFERRLGANLEDLHAELHADVYRPQPYYQFWVREPKPRLIHAPAFRDVVVQHAIYRVIYPLLDRRFIATSFACRRGKGTHRCADYVQRALRAAPADSFYLHRDIKRYFCRIDRGILARQLERFIKDARLLGVMLGFSNHNEPLGIPIGNLLSQVYALVYLNPVDHYIKRTLGVRHYARYVDDLLCIGLPREQVAAVREAVTVFLRDELRVDLSKAVSAPVRRGVNFVGYRTWRRRRFVRRHSLHSFSRALRAGRTDRLNSLMAHARHTATHAHYCRRLRQEAAAVIPRLPLYQEVA